MGRPKKVDSASIKNDFITSSCTLGELANRNNVSYSLVTKLASKGKWFEKRDTERKRIAEETGRNFPKLPATAQQHLDRSLITGDQIHHLLKEAAAAIRVGDIRSLKTLVDAWSSWDNQMRKTHKLDEQNTKPQINVALLASLPDTPSYIDAIPPLKGPR